MNDCWNAEYKERKSLNDIMKILNNPPSMEESNNDTLLHFSNMRRSQSFINKSLKVNTLMNKIHRRLNLRSPSKISEIQEEEIGTTTTNNNNNKISGQNRLLSQLDENSSSNDKKSMSEASISTLSSTELENYIQSIKNNSVTALLSDTDMTTLKLRSEDDYDEITKAEMEKFKKRNRRSLSQRLSFRRSSSSIFNVSVFSDGTSSEMNGQSFIISADGENSRHKRRSSTMKRWALSPDHFLSMSRKTFRKDSSNLYTSKPEMKVINELPVVEEPTTYFRENNNTMKKNSAAKPVQKIIDNKIIKEVEELEDQETQTLANTQEELTEKTEKEITVTEKETSISSIPMDNKLLNDNEAIKISKEKISKTYPSPENSIHAL